MDRKEKNHEPGKVLGRVTGRISSKDSGGGGETNSLGKRKKKRQCGRKFWITIGPAQ